MRPRGSKRSVVAKKRPLPPSSEHDEHSDTDAEVSPTTPGPGTPPVESVAEEGESVSLPGRSKTNTKPKQLPLELQPEQEQEIADWFRENEFLYNYRSSEYKNRAKKIMAWESKAKDLGISSKALQTWVKSMRDKAGKIEKKPKSGDGAKMMTDREEWIRDKFGFLTAFIKRVDPSKREKGGGLHKSFHNSTTSMRLPSTDDDNQLLDDESSDGQSECSAVIVPPSKGPEESSNRYRKPPRAEDGSTTSDTRTAVEKVSTQLVCNVTNV